MLTKRQIASLIEAGRELARDNSSPSDFSAFLDWVYTCATEYDIEHEGEPSEFDADMIVGLFMGGALGERVRLLSAQETTASRKIRLPDGSW